MVATGTVGYFLYNVPDNIPLKRLDSVILRYDFFKVFGKKENLQFFIAVVGLGWILVMALFSLFITGRHEKISQINWTFWVSGHTFHASVSQGCILAHQNRWRKMRKIQQLSKMFAPTFIGVNISKSR